MCCFGLSCLTVDRFVDIRSVGRVRRRQLDTGAVSFERMKSDQRMVRRDGLVKAFCDFGSRPVGTAAGLFFFGVRIVYCSHLQ